jgi:hypothetical protein
MSTLWKSVNLILLTMLLISCSKSNDNIKIQTEDCALASLSEMYNGATTRAFFYTYDNQGRVSRIDYDTKPSATYETYTYSADKIVVSGTVLGNSTAVYELDGNGRVAKYGSATFFYNSTGYLVRSSEVNGPHSTNITYTYQDSNLVRVDQVGNYGGPQPVTTTLLFEYNEALAVRSIPPGDPLNNFGSSRSVLGSYFGKGSKNLVEKEISKSNSSADETRTHTYTRDEKGNITFIRTLVSDGRVGEKRLTYSCN